MNKSLQIVAILLWLGGVAWGTAILLSYENTPAQAAEPPKLWPSSSSFTPRNDRFTLVLLAHPNCPCTRASLAELEIIMAQSQGRLVSVVFFSKPGSHASEMRGSPLWRKAESIPGVQATYDDGGAESRRFDGYASGQTMLYAPNGALLFSGGITSGRGHQGDNEGAYSIVHLITGPLAREGSTALQRASVFGCALNNPNVPMQKAPPWQQRYPTRHFLHI